MTPLLAAVFAATVTCTDPGVLRERLKDKVDSIVPGQSLSQVLAVAGDPLLLHGEPPVPHSDGEWELSFTVSVREGSRTAAVGVDVTFFPNRIVCGKVVYSELTFDIQDISLNQFHGIEVTTSASEVFSRLCLPQDKADRTDGGFDAFYNVVDGFDSNLLVTARVSFSRSGRVSSKSLRIID